MEKCSICGFDWEESMRTPEHHRDTYELKRLHILEGHEEQLTRDFSMSKEPEKSGYLRVGNLPTMTDEVYVGLGKWWVQLWNGDYVFARVYGDTPDEARILANLTALAFNHCHGRRPLQADEIACPDCDQSGCCGPRDKCETCDGHGTLLKSSKRGKAIIAEMKQQSTRESGERV